MFDNLATWFGNDVLLGLGDQNLDCYCELGRQFIYSISLNHDDAPSRLQGRLTHPQ